MLAESLHNRARNFANEWNKRLAKYPNFQLDFSWPSVGALDYIVPHLKGMTITNQEDRRLLTDISCYLAVIGYNTWSKFPGGLQVEARISEDEYENVTLSALGGTFLDGTEMFVANISKILRSILERNPSIFKFYAKKVRYMHSNAHLINTFAIGLITGAFPYGNGPWRSINEESFMPCLISAAEELALSSAKFYASCFPDEPLGQEPALYKNHLILPPISHSEKYPAIRGVSALIAYVESKKTNPLQLKVLAENLMQLPDELISSVGYSVACALSGTKPSYKLRLVGYAKGILAAYLRPAVVHARKLLQIPEDHKALLAANDNEGAWQLIMAEKKLGLIPLFRISKSSYEKPELGTFVEALLWHEPYEAGKLLLEMEMSSAEIILQRCYLELLTNSIDHFKMSIKELQNKQLDKPDLAFMHELIGIHAVQENDLQEAIENFSSAIAAGYNNQIYQAECKNYLVGLNSQLNKNEVALSINDAILSKIGDDPLALINKFFLSYERNDKLLTEQALEKLSLLAPFFIKMP